MKPRRTKKSNHQVTTGSTITDGLVVCEIDSSSIDAQNKQRIHLIPVNEDGMVIGVDGRRWHCNAQAVAQRAHGYPVKIPGDYFHASITANETGAKAPASGWIDPDTVTAEQDGIWAEVEWTPEAANSIRNKEYRYISPVFSQNSAKDQVIRLKGFGLTHYPNLGDLTPVANQRLEDNQMEEELLERFKYLLNLPELATPEEIIAEMERALERIRAMLSDEKSEAANTQDKTLIALLDQLEDHVEAVAANSQQLDPTSYVPRHEFDKVKQALDDITARAEQERVELAVNEALEKGVITPASKDWAMQYCAKDPEGFAQFAANAAQAVPVGEETYAQAGTSSLTDEEIAVCQQLGIDQEEYKKQKELEHGIN